MSVRRCYFIHSNPVVAFASDRGWIPSAAEEGSPGYGMMMGNGRLSVPWYWGMTRDIAQKAADDSNRELGLSEDDVTAIFLSALAASRVAGNAEAVREFRWQLGDVEE